MYYGVYEYKVELHNSSATVYSYYVCMYDVLCSAGARATLSRRYTGMSVHSSPVV